MHPRPVPQSAHNKYKKLLYIFLIYLQLFLIKFNCVFIWFIEIKCLYLYCQIKQIIMETKRFNITDNKVLKVIQDNQGCTESPREWDNLCKMIFIGKNSHLGDKHNFHDTSNYESFEEHQKGIEKELNVAFIAPVYAYSHSGMTISLEPFSCPWDSGILGWVVMTKEDLRENYGVKRVTKALIEKAMVHPKGEIETLDQYITGDIYGFQVVDKDDEDNIDDSCWGFFGSDITTNGILDHILEEDRKLIEAELCQ